MRSIWIALFCSLAWSLAAQAPPTYSFIRYTTEHGLSHDEVTCILKDADGFLWFGTVAGLNRFDGRSFKVFLPVPGDAGTLPGETIFGLAQDGRGRIWVSTDKGLCWYEPGSGRFRQVDPQALPAAVGPSGRMSRLAFDRAGQGWFVAGDYLVRMDPDSRECALTPLPKGSGGDAFIHIDRRGDIWISVYNRVYRFDPRRRLFHLSLGVEAVDPRMRFEGGRFFEDEEGALWVSSWGNGLYRYDPAVERLVDVPDPTSIATCFFREKLPGGRARFWVGGGIYGLFLLTLPEGTIQEMAPNPYEPYSHNGAMVEDIFRDPQTGLIWLATERGIEKHDPYAIRFQRGLIPVEADFTQFSYVSAFLQDRRDAGAYWIGVWGTGLYRWERRRDRFRRYKYSQGLSSNEVFDLLQDSTGRLYIAVFGGVDVFEPGANRWRSVTGFMKAPNRAHKVLSLAWGHEGHIWIGSNYDGLFRYDPRGGAVEPIPFCDSLQFAGGAHRVSQLAEDAGRRLWIATFNGAYCYDPASGRSRRLEKGFPLYYSCDDLCVGRDGAVWIATRSGLFKVSSRGELLAVYGQEHGLPTDQVHRVRESRDGYIWIGTNKGLFRLDPRSGYIEGYNKADGLFSNVLFDGFDLMPDGELFIGFQNAFNYFPPEQVPRNLSPPRVVLTGLRVMNQERPVEAGREVRLSPRENVVTFEFAALNYSQPEKNRYAYKLEGFDDEWVYTSQPSATYTNLDGGGYTLRVRAANNDGVWNETDLILPLRVIPPFHRSIYLPLLLVVLIIGVAIAVAQYRRLQRLQLEAIRNRIARDLHDDMGSTLSSIRFFSEYARAQLEKTQPAVVPVLQRISSSAAALSESMQDIIWTINSRQDKLDDLVTRMREFGFRTLEARQINFTARISKGFRPLRLGIGQRRNLYLIFKEAVNNASKYAGCSEVILFLTIVRGNLKMVIEDNGQGFDPATVRQGNGLRNMQQRARELGGEIHIRSRPGEGTRVELTARVK